MLLDKWKLQGLCAYLFFKNSRSVTRNEDNTEAVFLAYFNHPKVFGIT